MWPCGGLCETAEHASITLLACAESRKLFAFAGILLAVTIIYQYFETYEKEKAQQGGALF